MSDLLRSKELGRSEYETYRLPNFLSAAFKYLYTPILQPLKLSNVVRVLGCQGTESGLHYHAGLFQRLLPHKAQTAIERHSFGSWQWLGNWTGNQSLPALHRWPTAGMVCVNVPSFGIRVMFVWNTEHISSFLQLLKLPFSTNMAANRGPRVWHHAY